MSETRDPNSLNEYLQQLRDDLQLVQERPKSVTAPQKNSLPVKVDQRPPSILLISSTPTSKTYLDVEFDDVIAEPEGTHSDKCVWRNARYLFTCSKNCCYRTLTLICALPVAFIVGCSFACLTFQHVWCIGPALRQFSSNCYILRQFLSKALDSCIGPCCAAIGLVCSRVRVTHNNDRNPGV